MWCGVRCVAGWEAGAMVGGVQLSRFQQVDGHGPRGRRSPGDCLREPSAADDMQLDVGQRAGAIVGPVFVLTGPHGESAIATLGKPRCCDELRCHHGSEGERDSQAMQPRFSVNKFAD